MRQSPTFPLLCALVGLTVAIIVTEIRRLFRGFKGIKPAELTQLMNAGGTVVVDSEPGKGCTFALRLPLRAVG